MAGDWKLTQPTPSEGWEPESLSGSDWALYDDSARYGRGSSWLPERFKQLALRLCNYDDQVRLSALGEEIPHALLPLVAVRCADRVAPVREAALAVLAAAPPEALVDAADTVLWMSRRKHGAFAEEFLRTRFLRGEPALLEGLLTDSRRVVRRWAHRHAVADGLLDTEHLMKRAASGPDLVVREMCASAVLAAQSVPEELHERLLLARPACVRTHAVDALPRNGRPERALALLADRSGAVRACAQRAVRAADLDPALHYRRMLAGSGTSGTVTRGMAAGLGECGEPSDAVLLTPLLTHETASVRAAAASALRALDAVKPAALAPLLDDPSPPVVRKAAGALTPHASKLSVEELRARLGPGHPSHVRRAALVLLKAQSKLGAVEPAVLTPLLDDPSSSVVRRAAEALTPHASQLDEEELRARLDDEYGLPVQVRRAAAKRLLNARQEALTAHLFQNPATSLRARTRKLVWRWFPQPRPDATRFAAAVRERVLRRLLRLTAPRPPRSR
jgi:hypothetical protein